jgi:hypothetical protein
MIKLDEKSNAQAWELEVTCRNKKYLDEVVKAILKYGFINFEVELVECLSNHEEYNGRYTVLMWCSWFNNLSNIAKDLAKIETKFEKI